jgi:hypothetical protein
VSSVNKHKSRADRKSERQRASRAKERGLPAASSETASARSSFAAKRPVRLRHPSQNNGSAWLLVLVGAILVLGVVFVIAQNRKASVMNAPAAPAPRATTSSP